MSIDDHIGTVNGLIKSYGRVIDTNPAAPQIIAKLRAVADFLAEQKRLATPIPRDLGDLSDLPEELIRELSVKRTDELEDQILTVMRACDGGPEINLDQILVGLYRKFKVVLTRKFLQNKLYRMYKKELAFPVPGRRAYSLDPQPAAEEPAGYDSYDEEPSTIPARRPASADLDDEIPF